MTTGKSITTSTYDRAVVQLQSTRPEQESSGLVLVLVAKLLASI